MPTFAVTEARSLLNALTDAAEGDRISLAPGTYRLDSPVELARALTIVGAGSGQTCIEGDCAPYLLRYLGRGRLMLLGIQFLHTGELPANVVVVEGPCDIRQCRFSGGVLGEPPAVGAGLVLIGDHAAGVYECEAEGNVFGIDTVTDSRAPLQSNRCTGNSGAGISWNGAAGVLRRNRCRGNGGVGIEATCGAPLIEDNESSGNGDCGILYARQGAGTARGNQCERNVDAGIWLQDDSAPRLEADICAYNTGSGIRIVHQAHPVMDRSRLWWRGDGGGRGQSLNRQHRSRHPPGGDGQPGPDRQSLQGQRDTRHRGDRCRQAATRRQHPARQHAQRSDLLDPLQQPPWAPHGVPTVRGPHVPDGDPTGGLGPMSEPIGNKLQGDLGEQARVDQLRAHWQAEGSDKQVVNLNDHKPNIPGLDLASPEGFESVKIYRNIGRVVSHILDRQSNDHWVTSKMRAVREAVVKDLRDIADGLKENGALPQGFPKDAPSADIVTDLQETNRYGVADNQEAEVRQQVTPQIRENPEGFGNLTRGDPAGIDAYCEHLCGRIVGAGKDLPDLIESTERATQAALPQPSASTGERLAAAPTEPEPALPASQAEGPGTTPTPATPEPAGPLGQTAGPEPAGPGPASVPPTGPGGPGPSFL